MTTHAKLVEITPDTYDVIQQIAYATADNMLGRVIYKNSKCYLHPTAAAALQVAITLADQAGYKIKIFDAYRCPDDHKQLWDFLPNPDYVADIHIGSNHSRGIALDVTLVDEHGQDLDMGTHFDAMEEKSHHFHPGHAPAIQRNRLLLLGIMRAAGFMNIKSEWWHYELPDAASYPLLKSSSSL
ncbi:D-alanyl-D-alanine dipeptidase [Leeia oryzae]|uniref:D-alanyl-D-alanine dipeptidase n=1 Tax=Leeia oryzae TaxID=356662 RepID=UPI00036A86E4|nr:D-alanyl-D-alanine dipeptidase [Leeia oryzae]